MARTLQEELQPSCIRACWRCRLAATTEMERGVLDHVDLKAVGLSTCLVSQDAAASCRVAVEFVLQHATPTGELSVTVHLVDPESLALPLAALTPAASMSHATLAWERRLGGMTDPRRAGAVEARRARRSLRSTVPDSSTIAGSPHRAELPM